MLMTRGFCIRQTRCQLVKSATETRTNELVTNMSNERKWNNCVKMFQLHNNVESLTFRHCR